MIIFRTFIYLVSPVSMFVYTYNRWFGFGLVINACTHSQQIIKIKVFSKTSYLPIIRMIINNCPRLVLRLIYSKFNYTDMTTLKKRHLCSC